MFRAGKPLKCLRAWNRYKPLPIKSNERHVLKVSECPGDYFPYRTQTARHLRSRKSQLECASLSHAHTPLPRDREEVLRQPLLYISENQGLDKFGMLAHLVS